MVHASAVAGQKTCFIISPIGEDGSDTRRRSDQVLRHLITPAVLECGYQRPVRADHIAAPGIITTQTIQQVVNASLVVADLSEANPNVYYELALRHAARRPLVQIIERDRPIPFDVAAFRTIRFDYRDLDDVERARTELVSQINAVATDGAVIENPVSVALDLLLIRENGDPQQRLLAELMSAVGAMSLDLQAIRKDIGIWDRLKVWEQLQSNLLALRESTPSTTYDIDDVMDKLDDIERTVDKLE